MAEHILKIEQIEKSFQETKVLKGINLEIGYGEFITLLGPSGCGKTTTLRIIAGLEEPDSGSIILEGKDVTHLAPNQRDVNTVFQNYALFPHMTVGDNIGYSRKLKKVPKAEIQKHVEEILELVQLEGFGDRMPTELSGGQRQRVAIARAIINRPKVLLLDEPLGALDLQLRHQMQVELKQIQKQLGITFVYITHDQEEALNMSDRIVVMKDGYFEQIGTPMEIYNSPKSTYVAEFVGSANILKGNITALSDKEVVFEQVNGQGFVTPKQGKLPKGKTATIAIRGEYLEIVKEHIEGKPCFEGVVKEKQFAGGSMHIVVKLKDGNTIVSYHHGVDCPVNIGDQVCATWDPDRAVLIDLEVDDD